MARDAAFTVRITQSLKDEIARLAEAEGRTLAQYVERVLTAHVAAQAAAKPPRK